MVDAAIQQRPIDEAVISRYIALMQDGVEFPPVEVVFDGKDHWLWDGFHRYHCAKKLGRTMLSAHVANGTKRNALWLSFSANKAHGFPRQLGVARKIIETILIDKSWSKKTLSAIARHVGVTKQYVSKIKDELLTAHRSTGLPIEEENGVSEPKTAQGSTSLPLSRSSEIEVQTKDGIPYTQRSQEKEHRSQEPPKDAVGRVIPEHLRELYEARKIISEFVAALTKIKAGVMQHIEARDSVFSLLNVTAFQSQYDTLRATLKGAMPYCVCVYCGGDAKDCKACHGLGLLNKVSYEVAPRELK
jgi:hypothetical protein